jgi:DNA-binding LacI/PurR family transcriptional regulator
MERRWKKEQPSLVTMDDVAKLAGVSQSTVSRVLNIGQAQMLISEETSEKVMTAVEQLGYFPNLTARSLRSQQTSMIAMLVGNISNPFYHGIVQTVEEIGHQHGYDMLIANGYRNSDNELRFLRALMRRPVDGIIMSSDFITDENIDQLIKYTGTVVVSLNEYIKHPEVDVLLSSDEDASYRAVKWLVEEKHHRQVGFIGVVDKHPNGKPRRAGYRRALDDCEILMRAEYEQIAEEYTVEHGVETMRALLSLPTPPTAVFVCSDIIAIGAMNEALDQGFRIPEDIAIVGFDDIPPAQFIRPSLTTLAQFPAEIGRQLANALFERIEGKYTGPRRTFKVPLRLVERQST